MVDEDNVLSPITNYFGGPKNNLKINSEWEKPELLANDVFLLCSDGLTDLIKDEEILDMVLKNTGGPSEACRRLIQTAKLRGGHDNITVLLLHIQKVRPKSWRWLRWVWPSRKKYVQA